MTDRSEVCFNLDWSRRADKLELLARRTVRVLRSDVINAVQEPVGGQEDGDYAKP